MKILILGFSKIKYMPYMNFYLDNLNREKHEIHIVYWNRDLQEENLEKVQDLQLHEFRVYQQDESGKFSKISSFFKYRKFVNRLLKKEKFDLIFVLHTMPGILLAGKLKKYKDRFIFDYRDSTYESFPPFKWRLGKIVKNSKMTFVSSDAFRRFLPKSCKEKIYTSHNLLMDSLDHREEQEKNGIPSKKIRMAFWGFIRNEDVNLKIIDKVGNDDRFELHYYGREQQTALNLKQYVANNQLQNIFFHGEYKPEDRYEFVRSTDIIHNIYSPKDANMMLAMGNKYYDGIIFRVPQVCMEGSFMGEQVEKNQVGITLNPQDKDFAEKLIAYLKSIDKSIFKINCDNALRKVIAEYQNGISKINEL